MKSAVKVSVVALALFGVLVNPVMSQTSETVLALQSKVASQAQGGNSAFNISFGSLNQGLLALANKPTQLQMVLVHSLHGMLLTRGPL